MQRLRLAVAAAMLTATPLSGAAQDGAPAPFSEADAAAAIFADKIQPVLARHCAECHRGDAPKGDFRLDALTADFAADDVRARWAQVLERVQAGEMPPEDRPRLAEAEVQALAAWVRGQIERAERERRAVHGRTPARRLNRVEYENTICDLLGVRVELQALLPEDAAADGFDNVAAGQHVSSFLLERYLEAADRALSLAIANGPQPPQVTLRFDWKEERHVRTTTERVFLHRDDALVCFSSSPWQAVTLWQFYPPDRGRYRFRLPVYAYQSGGAPVTFRLDSGPMLMGAQSRLVGYFDAPPDEPAVVEFVEHLEARSTLRLLPYGLASAQAVDKEGAEAWREAGLALRPLEIEGPLYDAWPPESHRRLFGGLPQQPAPVYEDRDRVEVVSEQPAADAERILRAFARRAFRRAVRDEDVQPFLDLCAAELAEGRSFEQAVRVGLLGILVAPDFLFLRESPGRLDDFALASRLSYFLWSTLPDDELLALAERGELGQPAVLRGQVERLLADPRAKQFHRHFVGQWLGLREIDATAPSHILYPEFDELLKVSMVREAELFFAEVLREDLSVTNFVASDFSLLNGRLARHYGIEGVAGWEFRRTPLPPESHRGGVLTMAGVLKVTANGTNTSPVLRGAWVLDRLLGTPPPRPPANVAAIEPDLRGAVTVREQLERHRADPACGGCHARLDPPGFALESFDVIGGWRERYRTTGNGDPVEIDGRRMHYLLGPPVDPSAITADGRAFADIDEFRRLLAEEPEPLARALARKLVTYATGAAPTAADEPAIDELVAKMRERNYGLKTLVHEIVQSELFRNK